MYLMDYHTHSSISPDARSAIANLAASGIKAGLSEMAVTDHFDLDDENGDTGVLEYDAEGVLNQLDDAKKLYGDKIRLLWGIEMGEGIRSTDKVEKVLKSCDFDFIIGSIHNLRGTADFHTLKHKDLSTCYGYLDRYLDELTELSAQGGFDVIGHLTYPLRYMIGRDGLQVDFRRYEERLRCLFKALSQSGRGIEINTSGLRGKLRDTMPPLWCLRLFRQCGGEIVTVGSDAHFSRDIGAGIREGYAALAASGFWYVTAFEKRKPIFHKI